MKPLTVTLLALFFSFSFLYGQDLNTIEKVTFHGFTNPNNDSIQSSQEIDSRVMSTYLKSAKQCKPYFPKGASIYVTLEFKSKEKILLQFIAGGYDIFHIIKVNNNYLSDWYQLDLKHKKEWNELIHKMIE